jgi:outer membrane usher protein
VWIRWLLPAIFLLLASPLQAADKLILSVTINSQPVGETFAYRTDSGDILLPSPFLRDHVGDRPWTEIPLDNTSYVSLTGLKDRVQYILDIEGLSLDLTVDPGLFPGFTLDLHPTPPDGTSYPRFNSAYLNYSVIYDTDEDHDLESLSVPTEAVIRWGEVALSSGFSYTRNGEDSDSVRMLSSLVWDEPNSLVRLTIGDFGSGSGDLGGSKTLGGISLRKNFGIDPYFVSYPNIDLAGTARTPATLEVYRNGALLRREEIGAGPFLLENIAPSTGSGEVVVVVTDAFGRETVLTAPFYYSPALLAAGVHQYSYDLGVTREELGKEDFQYGDPAVLFFHRVGLTNGLTCGIRGEGEEDLINIGVNLDTVLKGVGLFQLDYAQSKVKEEKGDAFLLSYSYVNNSLGISWRYSRLSQSRGYSNLTLPAGGERVTLSETASVFLSGGDLGTLSLNYFSTERSLSGDESRLTANYSNSLSRKLSMTASASRQLEAGEETELAVNLRYRFGGGSLATASHLDTDESKTNRFELRRNIPGRLGWGYDLSSAVKETDKGIETKDLEGEISYKGPYGTYSGAVINSDGRETYSVRASGSIAQIGRGLYFGQPISDSFAVVKVDGLKDIEVLFQNQTVGKTDSNGEAFVPFLGSYTNNSLTINDLDLPFNVSLEKDTRNIVLPYRGGAMVRFSVEKIQQVIGSLFIVDGGERRPARLWGLKVQIGSEMRELPVGSDGQFYGENVPAGSHGAVIYKGERQCRFNLVIPESEEMVVDLGEITCEPDVD